MDILLGMSILLGLLCLVFMALCGYAGAVDWLALLLHRHAEQVRRMHARHNAQMRTWWQAERRRARRAIPEGPAAVSAERRPDYRHEVAVWPLNAANGNLRLSSTDRTPAKPKRRLQSPQPH